MGAYCRERISFQSPCGLCGQVGSSAGLPALRQSVRSVGGGRVSVQQRRDVPAAAALSGRRARRRVRLRLHFQ